jgi:hypothetical protein
MTHDGPFFTIELPAGREAKESGATTSFFRSRGGKGALTVSTMRPPPGTIATVEAVLRLRGDPKNVAQPASDDVEQRIARWDVSDEATFWRWWIVVRPHAVANVSYHCHHTEIDQEIHVVDRAVRTLRVK